MAARKKAAAKTDSGPVHIPKARAVPVWEGGETRSQYLARLHQYALDHDMPAAD